MAEAGCRFLLVTEHEALAVSYGPNLSESETSQFEVVAK